MITQEDIEPGKDGLIDHIESFSQTFLKLTYTTVVEKSVNVSAVILNGLFIYLAVMFVLLFAAAGFAWWIGNVINNRAAGFFIVAGLFLLITCLLILLRRKIVFPFIRNLIVKKIYE